METKNWTVYEHICPNGKRYIGITSKKPEERWRNGRGYRKGHGKSLFSKAIEKYKWENIQHNILFNDLTEKEAKWLENYLICYYRTFVGFRGDCKGYNMTLGGDGKVGWKHSEESRKKMSKSQKGKHISEEQKIKISESLKGENNPRYGKHHTDESRRKISENHANFKGENNPNYGKPSPNKGKHHSEETKEKISKTLKGQISHTVGKHRVYREDGTYFYQ